MKSGARLTPSIFLVHEDNERDGNHITKLLIETPEIKDLELLLTVEDIKDSIKYLQKILDRIELVKDKRKE